jgi:hypothetical protein
MAATLDTTATRAPQACEQVAGSSFIIGPASPLPETRCNREGCRMGSVVKKRRKRMAKKKHRKLLRKTRVQRRRLGK